MSSVDWDFWLQLPAVTVWQACALSLNIDPDKMNKIKDAWMEPSSPLFKDESFRSAEEKEKFKKRLRLLSASIYTQHFHLYQEYDYAAYTEIYLKEMARWAVSVVHWDNLPPELLNLINVPDIDTVGQLEDKPEPSANLIKSTRGRPKVLNKKADTLYEIISHMYSMKSDSNVLPGSASDLLEACRRIEKAKIGEIKVFRTTVEPFKGWVAAAGYRFKTGRTLNGEKKFWTQCCVKTMSKIPPDIFT